MAAKNCQKLKDSTSHSSIKFPALQKKHKKYVSNKIYPLELYTIAEGHTYIRMLLKKGLGFARFCQVTTLPGTRNPKTQKLAVSCSFYPNKKKNIY